MSDASDRTLLGAPPRGGGATPVPEPVALSVPKLPDSCKPYKEDYAPGSWLQYNLNELGWLVHLHVKQALCRPATAKAREDLVNAQNYLNMMTSKLAWFKEQLDEADMALTADNKAAVEGPDIGAAGDGKIVTP